MAKHKIPKNRSIEDMFQGVEEESTFETTGWEDDEVSVRRPQAKKTAKKQTASDFRRQFFTDDLQEKVGSILLDQDGLLQGRRRRHLPGSRQGRPQRRHQDGTEDEQKTEKMKQADLEKHFRCGPVEAAYENSKWFSGFMKVLFLLVAIYFFWLMTGEAHLVEHLDNWAVLAFCLWRIHRQDDVMCYVTRKGLIVRRQFRSLHEFYDDQFHEERSLIFLPYKDIFVISDNWQEIQLGEAEEGGLAVLPVHLQFLSKRNKQRIIDRIKQAHETDDDESAH